MAIWTRQKALFDKAEQLEPDNSFVYRNLGLYYKANGNHTAACTNMQKAMDLNIVEQYGAQFIEELVNYCEDQ